MEFEIISTGDEVITGIINDTNATWLSQQLLNLGVQAHFRHTVGDDIHDITRLLEERSQLADFIFVNGGLGPTTDDNTSAAAAAAAHVGLVRHPEWVEKIETWHEKKGRRMSPTNLKQADLPEGAVMIDNPNGTACGFYLRLNRALCFFTPGVPSEFKPMFTDSILPIVKSRLPHTDDTVLKRFFLTGISESYLQEQVNTLDLPRELVIGYRASYPVIELKIISHHAQKERAQMNAASEMIRELVKDVLMAEDELDLAGEIASVIGQASVNVYDEVSSGLFGMQLSAKLNLQKSETRKTPTAEAAAAFLKHSDAVYTLILEQDGEGGILLTLRHAPSKLTRLVSVRLNTTLKHKAVEAYCMSAQLAILRLLRGQPLPKPQLGEVHEIQG